MRKGYHSPSFPYHCVNWTFSSYRIPNLEFLHATRGYIKMTKQGWNKGSRTQKYKGLRTPAEKGFILVLEDTVLKESWTFQLRMLAASPSTVIISHRGQLLKLWMNEQVGFGEFGVRSFAFVFVCSSKYRCCLERHLQAQVTGSVNKKGSSPFGAQLEAAKCHFWGAEPSFKGFYLAVAMVISLFAWQLQLTKVWGSVTILLTQWA